MVAGEEAGQVGNKETISVISKDEVFPGVKVQDLSGELFFQVDFAVAGVKAMNLLIVGVPQGP
jgi:hypothetical protein